MTGIIQPVNDDGLWINLELAQAGVIQVDPPGGRG